jgi:hypothetical protein
VTASDPSSDHPVDRLIVRLVRGEAEATPADVDAIVRRMATAPFNRHPVRVRVADQNLTYGGTAFGHLADSLELHLAKRIQREGQWSEETTVAEYLADLRVAVVQPNARVLVYQRAGQIFAGIISPTLQTVPRERLGQAWLPNVLVVHSATRGTLRTGYMFSTIHALNLPEEIRWLR